eukprot:c41138_g1_i1 orf=91-357(+)
MRRRNKGFSYSRVLSWEAWSSSLAVSLRRESRRSRRPGPKDTEAKLATSTPGSCAIEAWKRCNINIEKLNFDPVTRCGKDTCWWESRK